MLKYILSFCFLLGLSSCGNSSSTEIQPSPIIGEWNWVSTEGGIGGWSYTPKTEDYISKIVFHDQWNCSVFFNSPTDSVVQTGPYSVSSSGRLSHILTPGIGDSLLFDLHPKVVFSGAINLSKDSMLIYMDSISDGFSSLFIRQK